MLTRQRKLTLIISQPLIGMIRKPDTDKTFFKIILKKKTKINLKTFSGLFPTHIRINYVQLKVILKGFHICLEFYAVCIGLGFLSIYLK
jgi:hypothetical protein